MTKNNFFLINMMVKNMSKKEKNTDFENILLYSWFSDEKRLKKKNIGNYIILQNLG